MTAQHHTAKLKIEVDGTALTATLDQAVVSAFVDNCASAPDMFQITFRDPRRTLLAEAKIKIGSKMKIRVITDSEPGGQVLVVGEVTALEAEHDADGTMSVVRGFDYAHRLFRGRVTDTYKDVKYSDIARKVAGRAELEIGTIEESPTIHPYVAQANVSDWQFLRGLADEIGFEVGCFDGKFDFRTPTKASGAAASGDLHSDDPTQLQLGKRLLRFRSIVTAAEQVKQVQVRGWDAAQKQALVGVAPATTKSSEIGVAPADLAATFNSPDFVGVHTPYGTQAEVDAAAKAFAEQIAGASAEFEGVARGNAKLRAGKPISIGLVGKPFDGKYTLTATRHVYDPKDGYTTSFTVSGRQERSLFGLTSGTGSSSGTAMGPRIYGVVQALVSDVRDPLNQGRVKLTFPWLSDSYATDWARTVQLSAGNNRGGIFLSEVQDEVLVAFEHGDVRRPYVIGGLYNGIDKPKLDGGITDGGGMVKRRAFISRKGHSVSLEDDDTSKSGIWLKSGDGNLEISLDATGTKITISNGGGDIEIKGSNIKIEATGTLELKGGAGVKVDGGPSTEVKGVSIKLN